MDALLPAAAALAAVAVVALLLPALVARRVEAALATRLDPLDRGAERLERGLREELRAGRGEGAEEARRLREELSGAAAVQRRELAEGLAQQAAAAGQRLEAVRLQVEERLLALQAENAAQLEQVRQTVDEKLQGTLEQRLGASFRLVQGQLEAVQRGLGEMQSLAAGVGDLKRVLGNVKLRGGWGEVQLGALLEQMLAPDQFAANVAPRPGSAERVEFVVRLPGHDPAEGEVLLPIDAKFPVEDYQRLVEASERGDVAAAEEAGRALETRVRGCARDVHDKYLAPPRTTDFGILFLPTEGLYAEVVRRPGLAEALQRDLRVTVAGPSTLAALLTSLQLGFRTLAIQRRTSEVWGVLSAVKDEFGKFGDVIQKVERKLDEASRTLSSVGTRTRAIQRRLRDVQALPASDAGALQGAAGRLEGTVGEPAAEPDAEPEDGPLEPAP